jgi:3',5'-cyclic-AMP phosphodiesterase
LVEITRCALSDRQLALAALDRVGLLGLACGHVHRSILTSFSDRVASIGPSPAYAVSLDLATDAAASFNVEPPGPHLHRWSPEGGAYGQVTTHLMPVIASPAAPGCAQE